MTTFSTERIRSLLRSFEDRTVIVIGDLMLDRYIWGRVERISPEAPVPVVEIESESSRFGGAANVNHNVKALGARVIPVGVVGDDPFGILLKNLFQENGFETGGLITDPDRTTTVKTRIIAHNQHVVRTDREKRMPISADIQKKLMAFLHDHIGEVDGIILEDYDKGLLTPDFIHEVIATANARNRMVFVDPKFDHFFDYRDATLFKPNRKEAADKLGFRLDTDEALKRAGEILLEKLGCRMLLITLGEEGMVLYERDRPWVKVPTRAVRVHDVSGAGDTVIATMAVALCSGASAREAATIANHAAGQVCGEVGIVPVDRQKLLEALLEESQG